MSLHYSKEKYKSQLIDSMNIFKKSIENYDGFIEGNTFEDEATGIFVRMIKRKLKPTHTFNFNE